MSGFTLAAMALATAVATAQPPAAPAEEAVERIYAEGMRLYSRGQLQRALDLLEAGRRQHPDAGSLRYLLALTYRDIMPTRPEDAASELQKALQLDPGLPDGAAMLADILVRSGRGGEAREMLHRWIQAHPDDASALWTLGTFLVSDQRSDEGISLLQRAVELDPENARAWLELGRSYVRGGKMEHAVRPLERARALAPESPPVRYNLAQAYRATGQVEMASEELEVYQELQATRREKEQKLGREDRLHRAIMLNQQSVLEDPAGSMTRYSDLAALYKEGETVNEGRDFLAGVALAHPQLPQPAVGQALLEHGVGNDAGALELLERALSHDPSFGPALTLLPELDPGAGGNERAAALLVRAESRPDAPERLAFWRGLLALRSNRMEEAEEHLARALEAMPGDADVLLNLGVLYGRTGRLEQARSTFQTLTEQQPEDGEAWYNLALTEFQMRLPEPALKHVRKARVAGEKRPPVLNLLAQLLIQSGDRQAALEVLEQSLEQDPAQPAVRRALASLQEGTDP